MYKVYKYAFLLLPFLMFSAISCMPRCPINSCQTRMVHPHGGQEFRGMPWYKKQRPRIGEKLPKPSKEVQREVGGNDSRKKGKN